MTKQEAERLVIVSAHSLELAEQFVKAAFKDTAGRTTTEEAAGVVPESFLGLVVFGLMRWSKKHGYDFAECVREATKMDSQLQSALAVLKERVN